MLDIFQRQLHLITIKSLGPLSELRTLELLQQMTKLIVLLGQPAAFRNGRVTLARSLVSSARSASTSSGTASIGMHMIKSNSHLVVTNNLALIYKSQLSRRCGRPRNIARIQTRPIHSINQRGEFTDVSRITRP